MRAAELPGPHADAGVIGWDIGGAHVKACLLTDGTVREVVQWPCPLWQGLDRLDTVLGAGRGALAAHARLAPRGHDDRRDDRPVRSIASRACCGSRSAWPTCPGAALAFYAGDRGLVPAATRSPPHWASIASANWLATARLAARRAGRRRAGRHRQHDLRPDRLARRRASPRRDAATRSASPAANWSTRAWCARRCARSRRGSPFAARRYNVMNEFFATTADVYRLTGELDPRARPATRRPTTAPKDDAATRRRLARMIGLDARDARAVGLAGVCAHLARRAARHPGRGSSRGCWSARACRPTRRW